MNAFSVGKCHVYDAIHVKYDVITTSSVFPYTSKFMFIGVRNNKTQQIIR